MKQDSVVAGFNTNTKVNWEEFGYLGKYEGDKKKLHKLCDITYSYLLEKKPLDSFMENWLIIIVSRIFRLDEGCLDFIIEDPTKLEAFCIENRETVERLRSELVSEHFMRGIDMEAEMVDVFSRMYVENYKNKKDK